jgi:branched-chain amino acid transport system substrate-binding protein
MKVFGNGQMDWDNPYALGKDMVEIWAREMYYAPAYNNPLSKKFEKSMIKMYGENYFKLYQGHAGGGFDAVYAYKAAIEKAKSFDIEKIRKALEDLTFDSPNGKKWIRAGDHQAYFDIMYYHIVPDASNEAGWKVESWMLIDGKKNAIPVEEARKQ